jgi:hypothetical protein
MSKRQKQNCQVKIFQMLSTTVYYDLMNNLFWPLKDVYKNIYLDDKLSESLILRPQEKVFLLSAEANLNDISTQTFLKRFFCFNFSQKLSFLYWHINKKTPSDFFLSLSTTGFCSTLFFKKMKYSSFVTYFSRKLETINIEQNIYC